ncbi:MAG: methyl-accepting chemotaxis protein [Acetobacteraceae bacterium]
MFNRLTVKSLLQFTLVVLAATAIIPLASRAWVAWRTLSTTTEIVNVVDASDAAFQVIINLRSDRNAVPRAWMKAEPIAANTSDIIHGMQNREMPALRSLVSLLENIEIDDRARLLPVLRQSLDTLTRLQAEFWQGATGPISGRRSELAGEYLREGIKLQAPLEDVSAQLYALIQNDDLIVDRMMQVKQLAFRARDSAGDALLVISIATNATVTPDNFRKFVAKQGEAVAYWRSIDDLLSRTAIPPALMAAVSNARQIYFDPEYISRVEKALATLVAGGDVGVSAEDWAAYVIPRLDSVLGVAQAALTTAKERAAALGEAARAGLIVDSLLLLLVLGGVVAGLTSVHRRVLRPLHTIRHAMSQLADGILTETAGLPQHDDEIGALAGALRVFQTHAIAKLELERTDGDHRARAAKHQNTIEAEIHKFEAGSRAALTTLTGTATAMGDASTEMAAISTRTNQGMQTVASAAAETSGSVTGIAAASEQLSGSINEIGRHVVHATGVTGRAVEETRRTDTTVRSLTEAAGRIGEVVKLINDIAGRTNLLALNATIEAARAGDAGKGFAVVASEVKSLATQTAKATEEIARQITEVQNVTEETVAAIRLIGTTIEEVNDVATSIAAGVEQQGALTREIARNVEQAARRTLEMTETITQVSRDAQAADATARGVCSASASMAGETATLRQHVDSFLQGIRAA